MNRNAALDWFRGLLLVVMTVDHLPGLTRLYSFEALGFASAAEGFVFLSGFVAALVYGREPDPVRRRDQVFARVGKIYKYHLLLLFGILALSFLLPDYAAHWTGWLRPFDSHPTESLMLAFGLLYQPQFLDILPMYCVFLAVLPAALKLLRAGQGAWLLLGSFLIWLVGQGYTGSEAGLRDFFSFPFELGFFNLLAWQFLFFLGAYFGYRSRAGQFLVFTPASVFSALAVALFLYALRHQLAGFAGIPVGAATERSAMAWLRLVDVLVLAYLLAGLVRLAPALFRSAALEALGRNSLQVYTYHVLLVYLLSPLMRPWVEAYGWRADLGLTALAVASLSLPIYVYGWYQGAQERVSGVWQRWVAQA